MAGKDAPNSFNPRDYRRVFSQQDKKAVVYVNWQTNQKEKFNCTLRFFDADNRPISESKSREFSLAPGKFITSTWDIPVENMPPGIYRVDLILDGQIAWRDFLRITN
jgi:hypothetical protein